MDDLKLKIDTKAAQVNLDALSKSLDKVTGSSVKMDGALAASTASVSISLAKATKAMEKYANVAALLSKIKVAGNPVGQIRELGQALDTLGKARMITTEKVAGIRELSLVLNGLKTPERLATLSVMINALGKARFPSAQGVKNLGTMFAVLNSYKPPRDPTTLERLFAAMANLRAPSASAVTRVAELFRVIQTAKEIPNANKIVFQLNEITAAATRAGQALSSVRGLSGIRGGSSALASAGGGGRGTGAMTAVAAGAAAGGRGTGAFKEGEAGAKRMSGAVKELSGSMESMTSRFQLGYQAGTLLTAMFSSITIGTFIKGVYEANIQLLKLQKALIFSTGSFKDANSAADKYIGMSQELGLSIKDNIETYGRFVIASKASNVNLDETNKIYHAVGQALTVVGASAQQQGLAMYGLTEIMQKGVVYSKEFNRQIGAQLPGNAILGARALSKLEGHAVSVEEFFKRMHTGTLLAPDFIPAWAKAVEDMYHPLLALAQARPDVAITRLKNSFFVFAREVGQGKFMTAIGGAINNLTAKFVTFDKDGTAHLTKGAKDMADAFGSNLAGAIQKVGNFIGFLIDHMSTLMTMLKAFLTYKIADEFLKWGNAAAVAASRIGMIGNTMSGLGLGVGGAGGKAAPKAAAALRVGESAGAEAGVSLASIMAGRSANSGAARGASSVVMTGTGASRVFNGADPVRAQRTVNTGFGRRVAEAAITASPAVSSSPNYIRNIYSKTPTRDLLGGGGFAAKFAGDNSELKRFAPGIAPMVAGGQAAMKGLETGMKGLATGSKAALSGIMGLGAYLPGLGTLALAAAIGIGLLWDQVTNLKTLKGNDIKYSDIFTSIFSDFSDSFTGFISDISDSILSLIGMKSGVSSFGVIIAVVATSLKAVFGGLFALAKDLGTVLGTAISQFINYVVRGAQAVDQAIHGHFKDAAATYAQGAKERDQMSVSAGKSIFEGKQNEVFDIKGNINKIMDGATESADTRKQKAVDESLANKNLEAVMRQQNSASIIEAAAQKFADSSTGMEQLSKKLDPKQVLSDIKAFAAGDLTAGMSDKEKKAMGPASNKAALDTIANAAGKAGISPDQLFGVWMAESGGAMSMGKTKAAGQTATGPFQINNATYDELSGKIGAFDRTTLEGSAYGAATRIAQGQKSAGRELTPGESYIPYFMGPAGGAKFIKEFDKDSSQNAAKLFPSEAAANKNIFYGGSDGKTPLTLQDVYSTLINKVTKVGVPSLDQEAGGEPNPLGGGTSGGASDKSINNYATQSYKTIMGIVGEGNPAAQADSELQSKLATLKKVREGFQAKNAGANPWAKTFLGDPAIQQGLDRAIDRLQEKANEALDPIQKMNRLQTQGNDITAMRAKGLNDEADYQAKVNDLIEQGYLATEVDNKANKDAFMIQAQRARFLQSEIDLKKQLLDIDVKRMTRQSNNPLDNIVNEQIAGHAQAGEDFQSALKRQTASGEVGNYQKSATAQVQEQNDAAQQGMNETIGELKSTYGLNPTAKSLRDDYKRALQDMTGLSTDSLDRLNSAASQAQKNFAESYAKTKHELENPPGFQRWVDGLKPVADRLEDIKAGFAEDLSNGITDSLMGDKVDWAGMFHNVSKQMMKVQVDNMLAGVYKSLGIVKEQTPQEKQAAAADKINTGATQFDTTTKNFDVSTNTFSSAVDSFAQAVSNGVNAGAGGAGPMSGSGSGSAAGGASDSLQSLSNSINNYSATSQTGSSMMPGTMADGLRGSYDTGGGTSDLMSQLGFGSGATPDISPYSDSALQSMSSFNPSDLQMNMPSLGGGLDGGSSGGWFSGIGDSLSNMWGSSGGGGQAGSGVAGFFGSMFGNGDAASPMAASTSTAGEPTDQMFGGQAGGGGMLGQAANGIFDGAKTGDWSGVFSMLGPMGALLGGLFGGKKKAKPIYHDPNGIIGNMSQNVVHATQVAAHSNPIGEMLNMAAQTAISMYGQGMMGGGGGTSGFMSGLGFGQGVGTNAGSTIQPMSDSEIGSFNQFDSNDLQMNMPSMGSFREGGYTNAPVQSGMARMSDFNNAPHYAEGTHNTSGIPAIVHPNEAVIPLSRGRKIPVEMGDEGSQHMNFSSNITIVAPDPDSFRAARGTITRDQNRMLKRGATRNLTSISR